MQHPSLLRLVTRRGRLGLGLAAAAAAVVVPTGVARIDTASAAPAARQVPRERPTVARRPGSVQLSGLLPATKLTVRERAPGRPEQGDVRLPLYPGDGANGKTVWYVLLDASDAGSRTTSASTTRRSWRTSRSAIPRRVQTVTLDSPTPEQNRFGPAVVHFQGAPDFSPTRVAEPGPDRFPLATLPAGRGGRPRLQPVHPDRGLADGLQRADRRHRRRSVRRHPPHQHRRPGARRPHRRRRQRPASSPSPGSTCCSSRASTPASRSSTSAPTPASR